MEAVVGGTDLLCVSGLGVGEETVAAAILAALYGGTGRDWTTPNSRTDAAIIEQRAAVIDKALALHKAHLRDPLEVLRRLGGREFAAIAGAILAARTERAPVVLDGPAALAVAAVLYKLDPSTTGHCLLAQRPLGPSFAMVADNMALTPLLDLQIAQGQGTAAAIAAGLIKAAVQIAATLAEANRRSAAS
jgi:nicotinate-nucleotide--dimethylbenzimidazole phosphoribosyltransferase